MLEAGPSAEGYRLMETNFLERQRVISRALWIYLWCTGEVERSHRCSIKCGGKGGVKLSAFDRTSQHQIMLPNAKTTSRVRFEVMLSRVTDKFGSQGVAYEQHTTFVHVEQCFSSKANDGLGLDAGPCVECLADAEW